MALSKVDFNSMNVTPAASKAIKFNSSNNGLETGDIGGSLVLLSTTTASSSATIDITSGIDSTYKEYQVHFFDVHPQSGSRLAFQVDTGTNTNYNQTITSTAFVTRHSEDNSTADLGYNTGDDLAQSTSFQRLSCGGTVETDADASATGILHLFDPANTTFVKHFMATMQIYNNDQASHNSYVAGYINTTTAITRIRFKYESGNIDAGTFKLYGVS
jgi:hypothetical protein